MVREMHITPVLNGFIVKVGCQQLVASSAPQLADSIEEYYNDPDATEARFIKRAVNQTMNNPVAPQAMPAYSDPVPAPVVPPPRYAAPMAALPGYERPPIGDYPRITAD